MSDLPAGYRDKSASQLRLMMQTGQIPVSFAPLVNQHIEELEQAELQIQGVHRDQQDRIAGSTKTAAWIAAAVSIVTLLVMLFQAIHG